jgi:hypothetical protein
MIREPTDILHGEGALPFKEERPYAGGGVGFNHPAYPVVDGLHGEGWRRHHLLAGMHGRGWFRIGADATRRAGSDGVTAGRRRRRRRRLELVGPPNLLAHFELPPHKELVRICRTIGGNIE